MKSCLNQFWIMTKVAFLLKIILSLFFIGLISCEKNKTPLDPLLDNITSHDYIWTVDTLHAPDAMQVMMHGIWGTDENNVWVVGHSDVTKYQIWHWDGKNWQNHKLIVPGHPHSLGAIYGFSASDIWAVGTDFQDYPNTTHHDFIIHYDGSSWNFIEGLDAPLCLSVWGNNSADLFVGCDSGIVLHYDGSHWNKQHTGTHAQILSIKGTDAGQVYAIGAGLDDLNPYDSTFYYFFKYSDSRWNILDNFIKYPYSPTDKFGENLWISPEGSIYTVGNDGLFRWNENAWNRLRTEQLFSIGGTGWNNIFTGGWGNALLHFNGERWKLYDEFLDNSRWIGDIWCDEKNAFIIGRAYFKSFIYRGKLIK